jgi:hypothetical protein
MKFKSINPVRVTSERGIGHTDIHGYVLEFTKKYVTIQGDFYKFQISTRDFLTQNKFKTAEIGDTVKVSFHLEGENFEKEGKILGYCDHCNNEWWIISTPSSDLTQNAPSHLNREVSKLKIEFI